MVGASSGITAVAPKPVVLIGNADDLAARSFETVFPLERFDVCRVASGPLTITAARELRPLVVIVDYEIPELDCAAVCRTLSSDPTFAVSTPIVITSQTNPGRAQQLAALRAGAWDFCVQPLNGDVFFQKIMAFVGPSWMVHHALLESVVDDPTGLYTDVGFLRRASEFAAQLARDRQAATLLLIRIEDGDVDTRGELIDAAHCVQRVARASDLLARLGEREIAIMMRECGEAGVRSLLERIRDCLTVDRIPRAGEARVTARYGNLALNGNVPGDVGLLIDDVRAAPGVVL